MIGERNLDIKKSGDGRRELLLLENTGNFVFHGSPDTIDILEPRQAYNHIDGKNEEDGEPAVFATPYADTAIFRALISNRDVKEDSESIFGMDEDGLHFSATQNLIDSARGKVAKVYVLDRNKFTNLEGAQCRSLEKISPIQVIEVTFDDLPPNISTIK